MLSLTNDEKSTSFVSLLEEAYSYIKNRDFGRAVALYNDIYHKYSELSEEQKTLKLRNDIKTLFDELKLYMDVNEAFILAEEGNLALLRKELEKIHDLAYEIPATEQALALLEYSSEKYKLLLGIYTKKIELRQFEALAKKIEAFIHEKKYKEAMLEYSKMVITYRKLLKYISPEKKVGLYFTLRKIFKQLAIHSLLSNKHKASRKKEHKSPAQHEKSFEETYDGVQNALQRGDLKTAMKLYSELK